jgi:hypothetical protein
VDEAALMPGSAKYFDDVCHFTAAGSAKFVQNLVARWAPSPIRARFRQPPGMTAVRKAVDFRKVRWSELGSNASARNGDSACATVACSNHQLCRTVTAEARSKLNGHGATRARCKRARHVARCRSRKFARIRAGDSRYFKSGR